MNSRIRVPWSTARALRTARRIALDSIFVRPPCTPHYQCHIMCSEATILCSWSPCDRAHRRPAPDCGSGNLADETLIVMARQNALPPTLAPRLINRDAAAAYVSVSPTKFDQMVIDGSMP